MRANIQIGSQGPQLVIDTELEAEVWCLDQMLKEGGFNLRLGSSGGPVEQKHKRQYVFIPRKKTMVPDA